MPVTTIALTFLCVPDEDPLAGARDDIPYSNCAIVAARYKGTPACRKRTNCMIMTF